MVPQVISLNTESNCLFDELIQAKRYVQEHSYPDLGYVLMERKSLNQV